MESVLLIVGLVAAAGLVVGALRGAGRGRAFSAVELHFGSEVRAEAVEAVLASISGLPHDATVALETHASESGIRHLLRADQATLDTVSAQLRGLIPELRIEPAAGLPRARWTQTIGLRWSVRDPLLRGESSEEAATSLLATLTPLGPREAILLRVALRPARPTQLPTPQRDGQERAFPTSVAGFLFGQRSVERQQVGAMVRKLSGPLLEARVSVAVACGHPARAQHLLTRVSAT